MHLFFRKLKHLFLQKRIFSAMHVKLCNKRTVLLAGSLVVQSSLLSAQSSIDETQNELTLQKAIKIALNNDDWLIKSELTQTRFKVLSEGASALPDPTFSIGMLNMPTNSFAFDQEPMTQLKVGATQMFPRGDSLALEEKKLALKATEQPHLRDDRRLKVTRQITHFWLDAYEASASYQLVNDARPLFDKLGDIVSASYASSMGKANQQDIIRAELELIRLNDRLVSLDSRKRVALSTLSKFLFSTNNEVKRNSYNNQTSLPKRLPNIDESRIDTMATINRYDEQMLYQFIATHPLIDATQQRILAAKTDIELAKQAFKPQYSVNASYALRDDAQNGESRSDFISVGASVSVPLFSKTRQDANLAGAKLMTEAIRTEKRLIVRELMSGLSSAYQDYLGLSERFDIYQRTILPQMKQQSEAALNAYTNDTGDFAEVVRAKIAELDSQLTLLNIEVSKRKALSNIDYFSATHENTHTVFDTSNKDNIHD